MYNLVQADIWSRKVASNVGIHDACSCLTQSFYKFRSCRIHSIYISEITLWYFSFCLIVGHSSANGWAALPSAGLQSPQDQDYCWDLLSLCLNLTFQGWSTLMFVQEWLSCCSKPVTFLTKGFKRPSVETRSGLDDFGFQDTPILNCCDMFLMFDALLINLHQAHKSETITQKQSASQTEGSCHQASVLTGLLLQQLELKGQQLRGDAPRMLRFSTLPLHQALQHNLLAMCSTCLAPDKQVQTHSTIKLPAECYSSGVGALSLLGSATHVSAHLGNIQSTICPRTTCLPIAVSRILLCSQGHFSCFSVWYSLEYTQTVSNDLRFAWVSYWHKDLLCSVLKLEIAHDWLH